MESGHLLTLSGLTYPEVFSNVYHDSFCQLGSSVSLSWVIYFQAFYLHVVSSFSCIPVICPKLMLFLTPLQFVHLFCNLSQVYPAVILMYCISAAVILLVSLALIVQVSLLNIFYEIFTGYNKMWALPIILRKLKNYHRSRSKWATGSSFTCPSDVSFKMKLCVLLIKNRILWASLWF